MQRLSEEAQRRNMPLEDVISMVLLNFLEDDEPSDDEILAGLRQAMIDVRAGNTQPADQVLAELKAYLGIDDDEC